MRNWWVLDVLNGPGGAGLLAAWAIWVVVSITLHELAHGWAAISRGDTTPIDTGHMTWNPVVHMGPMSLLVFALTGIAWGLMPVDPTRMRGRHADAWVAFAGPLMNFSLAAVCIVASVVSIAVLDRSGAATPTLGGKSLLDSLILFFSVGCALNVTLGLFNLIPAPPLDGSRILTSFYRPYGNMLATQGGQFLGLVLFMVAFFFAGRIIGGAGFGVWRLSVGVLVGLLRSVGIVPAP